MSSTSPEKLCCDHFTWTVNDSGLKGVGAFPVEVDGKYLFILQARSHCPNTAKKVCHIETNISFCPWCGCNLDEFIQKHKDTIIELTEKHKQLLE